jgi:hypothetical protein
VKDEGSSDPKLAVVYSASQMAEAEMVKAILEDAGIPALVDDERLSRLVGWPLQVRGHDVRVAAEQADEARSLLETERGPDWTCPKCNEKIDGVFDACWKCGHERE